jgi:DNA helicase-2/ATP-dependent DNA helicase PcrA
MGRPPVWALPEETIDQETRDRYAGGEDEERRLFYVAMTRARDLLYLSHFDRTAQRTSRRSRFFSDVCPLETPWWDGPEIPVRVTPSRGLDVGPVAISLTELIRFDDCGHRYRLQRGLGFETQLVTELGFGRAIHHVLRRVAEEARESGRIPDLGRIEQIFDQELYFPFANRASEPQMKRKAKALVTRYVNNHRDDLTRIWATERPFELHLPQGFLSGRADVILDHEGGRQGSLAIVDYKSGTDGSSDEQFTMQLQIYAAAGRAEGLSVEAAYLHDLGQATGARTEIPTDAASCDAALGRMSDLFDRLVDRGFQPSPEPSKCSRCEFQQICGHRKGC